MNLRQKVMTATGAATLSIAATVVTYFEGYRPTAYLDSVGIPTICYGHTETARLGQTLSQEQCNRLLAADLGTALAAVDNAVTVPLSVERRAALASFTYNVGADKFAKSTLLAKLNAGDTAAACAELSRWVYAGGQKLAGLETRRAAERELCERGL